MSEQIFRISSSLNFSYEDFLFILNLFIINCNCNSYKANKLGQFVSAQYAQITHCEHSTAIATILGTLKEELLAVRGWATVTITSQFYLAK